MRVFISWSGARSGKLAEALYDWLPVVVAGINPFLSLRIESGVLWQAKIAEELRRSDAGLVCLTPESLASHWLHFEFGALANAVHQKPLFLFAHRLDPESLPQPLQAYQSKPSTRAGTLELVQDLARAMNLGAGDDYLLKDTFDREWPSLARVISSLSAVTIEAALADFRELFNTHTFTEPMPECGDASWTHRHERLARVHALLSRDKPRVVGLREAHLMWLYDGLLHEIKSYMTNLVPVLLAARDGRQATVNELMELDPKLIEQCEIPRTRILALVERLVDPGGAPVLDSAVTFEKAGVPQRKRIAFEFDARVQGGDVPLSPADLPRALNSLWELDRVVAYQVRAATVKTAQEMRDLVGDVQRERARAAAEPKSLMALHCSLRALDVAARRLSSSGESAPDVPVLLEALREVEDHVVTNRGPHADEILSRVRDMRQRLTGAA